MGVLLFHDKGVVSLSNFKQHFNMDLFFLKKGEA